MQTGRKSELAQLLLWWWGVSTAVFAMFKPDPHYP
jgi:hypothetical protein